MNRSLVLFILVFTLLFYGCAIFKPNPTEECQTKINVNDFGNIEEFDKIGFLELAIEVGKEKGFPPPMYYEKSTGFRGADGIVIFGKEGLDRMPGLPMVIHVFIKERKPDQVCINAILHKKDQVTKQRVKEIMEDYSDELSNQYKQKQENLKAIMKKYQH